MEKDEKEIIIFAAIILLISWLPMIINNPVPENSIPQELLDNPELLFPAINGYSGKEISTGFKNTIPVLCAGHVSAYLYTPESGLKQVWVLIQKSEPTTSLDQPKACYEALGWKVRGERKGGLGSADARYIVVEKGKEKRIVAYTYFRVVERKQRFFVFYLPKDTKGIVFIRIETPYDSMAIERIKYIGSKMIENIEMRIEEAS